MIHSLKVPPKYPSRLSRPLAGGAAASLALALTLSSPIQAASVTVKNILYTGDKISFKNPKVVFSPGTIYHGSFAGPGINDKGEIAFREFVFGKGLSSTVNEMVLRKTGKKYYAHAQENVTSAPGYLAQSGIYRTVDPFKQPGSTISGFSAIYFGFDDFVSVLNNGQVTYSGICQYFANGASAPDTNGKTTYQEFKESIDTLSMAKNSSRWPVALEKWEFDVNSLVSYDLPYAVAKGRKIALNGIIHFANDVELQGVDQGPMKSYPGYGVVFFGTTYGLQGDQAIGLPIRSTFQNFGVPGTNNKDDMFFSADVSDPGDQYDGIWYTDGTRLRSFLIKGTTAPQTDGGTYSAFDSSVSINDARQIAFLAQIAGGKYTQGIWTGRAVITGSAQENASDLKLAAAVGQSAPVKGFFPNSDKNSATFATLSRPLLNKKGTLAFRATLNGPATTSNEGIYAALPNGQIFLVVRKGDQIVVNGSQKRIIDLQYNEFNGLNNKNEIVFTASFDESNSGVFVAKIQ